MTSICSCELSLESCGERGGKVITVVSSQTVLHGRWLLCFLVPASWHPRAPWHPMGTCSLPIANFGMPTYKLLRPPTEFRGHGLHIRRPSLMTPTSGLGVHETTLSLNSSLEDPQTSLKVGILTLRTCYREKMRSIISQRKRQ